MRELIKTKYFKWGLTACLTLIAAVVVYFLLSRASSVHGALGALMDILAPFLYGIVIAYLLRPVYNGCYYRTVKIMNLAKIPSEKVIDVTSRIISVSLSILLLIFVLSSLFMMVIPELVSSIYQIILDLPKDAMNLINWVQGIDFVDDSIKDLISKNIDRFADNVDTWISKTLVPYLKEVAITVSAGIVGAASFVFDILIGLIVCVYILLSKTTFAAQAKKLSFSVFEKDTANTLINGARYVDRVFNGYVSGNIIDSLLVGVITFLVMSIFNWPFALLISALLAVTNLIPFFGPFIGGIPAAILILTKDPMEAVYFVIYMLIMQQVEGNIIKPKILSESVDLPSFWILFSIIVGGGLFGLVGMVLGVPVFTVIYTFIAWVIDRRLAKKNLPAETGVYVDVDCYDFEREELTHFPNDIILERKEEKKREKEQRRIAKRRRKGAEKREKDPDESRQEK